jgi:hypothetical protein
MSKIGGQISAALRNFEEDYEKFEVGNHAAALEFDNRARIAFVDHL